jgi:very-short-patch-repair endonuclease
VNGLPVTMPLLTTLDCARWLRPDWGVVIADAALHRGLIDQQSLAEAAQRVRRLKGEARARALPKMSSALAESPGESLLRLRLLRMGLEVTEQYSMPWVEGEPRVDFLVAGRLVVEFDGQGKYSLKGDPARAHWEEKLRHDRIVEAGNAMIHVVWAELWDEPALRRRVNRALARTRG